MTSWLAAAADQASASTWIDVVLSVLNVSQTLALAVMASRSRRVRSTDRPARSRDELVRELHRRRR